MNGNSGVEHRMNQVAKAVRFKMIKDINSNLDNTTDLKTKQFSVLGKGFIVDKSSPDKDPETRRFNFFAAFSQAGNISRSSKKLELNRGNSLLPSSSSEKVRRKSDADRHSVQINEQHNNYKCRSEANTPGHSSKTLDGGISSSSDDGMTDKESRTSRLSSFTSYLTSTYNVTTITKTPRPSMPAKHGIASTSTATSTSDHMVSADNTHHHKSGIVPTGGEGLTRSSKQL